MSEAQSGILEPIPAVGRYLAFSLQTPQALPDGLRALQQRADGHQLRAARTAAISPLIIDSGDSRRPGRARLWSKPS